MGTSASSAAMARIRTFAAAAVAFAFALALGLAPVFAFADDAQVEASSGVASTLVDQVNDSTDSSAEPQQVSALQDAGASRVAPMLASGLFDSLAAIISSDVALDAADPVVGSFTVDGLTYALNDGKATLVAVSPDLQQVTDSQSADDSRVAPMLASGQVAIPASVDYGGISYDVTAIGPYAFYLSGVTDVALPASVSSVDSRAFRSSDVAWADVVEGNPAFASSDGALYSADLTRLLLIPGGRQGAVRIDSHAEEVPSSAFSHCAGITAISVDAGGAAFSSWDGLLYSADGSALLRVPAGATDITIRDGCTNIAAGSMEGCVNLERIHAPASIASISPDAFSHETPIVGLPIGSALQGEMADTVASDSSDSAQAPQLTSMVALSTANDGSPEITPSSITVMLSDEAPRAIWTEAGFAVEGGNDIEMADDPAASAMLSEEEGENTSGAGADERPDEQGDISGLPVAALDDAVTYAATTANGERLYNVSVKSASQIDHMSGYSWKWVKRENTSSGRIDTVTSQSSTSYVNIADHSCWLLYTGTAAQMFTENSVGNAVQKYLSITPQVDAGYQVTGWTYGGSAISGSYRPTRAATLAPTISKVASLAVGLNTNGGSGGTGSVYYWPGKGYTTTPSSTTVVSAGSAIVSNFPTRSGRAFLGWYSVAGDSGGVCYIDKNGKLTSSAPALSSAATWYARWGYTVTFDRMGGSGGTSSVAVQDGASVPTISVPSFSGWTFSGYTDDYGTSTYLYVRSNGTGTTRTISDNKTLYANWTRTVTLDANGGTAGSLTSLTAGGGRPLGQKCTQVSSSDPDYPIRSLFSKGITDNSNWKPTRAGYTFAGYYDTSAPAGGTCWITSNGSGSTVSNALPLTLYARWTPSVFTVSLDKNGGSGGTSTIYLKYATGWYSDAAATANITSVTKPTLSGWTFAGYKGKDKNGNEYTYVNSNGSLNNSSAWWSDFTSDTTLTAVWTKSVTLDRQGGSGGSTSATYTKGEGFKGSITKPTAPAGGWTFLGYCDYNPSTSPGGNVYQMIRSDGKPTGRVYDSISSTIYAWWAKEVTLDKYATGATAGKVTKVWALKGARLGYSCTSLISNGVDYEADIRAKFPDPSPLKVTGWAPSRGSLASTWAFDGYWTAGADGSATQYIDSGGAGTTACPADMPDKLYAQWTRPVTLDKQGGSGGSDSTSQLYKNGETSSYPYRAVTPPTTPPSGSPGGWRFLGYCDYNPSTSPGGNVYQMIKSDGTSTGRAYSSTTLYAWWVKPVSLNKNASDATAGATTSVWALKGAKLGYACSTTASTEAEIRAKFPSSSPLKATGWAPTRPDRAFIGYSSFAIDTGGTLYVDAAGNGQVAVDANCPDTLNARWGYTVTFDKMGGSGGTDSVDVEFDSHVPEVSVPTLSGWTFQGYTNNFNKDAWLYVRADGLVGPSVRTIIENKTLYANWTKTVTLDANDGEDGNLTSLTAGIGRPLGQKCTQVASNNIDYPIRSLFNKGITDDSGWAPTRAGFTFAGYYDTSESTGGTCYIDADGTAQSVCSPVRSTMPSTLYARWSGNDITLTWDPHNGSTASTTTQTYSTTAKVTLPTAPEWEGRTFAGWYTAETGGTQVTNATNLPTASTTYHAHWTENSYTISYDYDGGDVSGNPTTYKVSSATFALKNPTKTGYTFTGWSGTGLEGDENMEVKIEKGSTGDRSYAAHWQANTYAVEYYDFTGTTLLLTDDGFAYDTPRALAAEPDASIVTPGYDAVGWASGPGQVEAAYGFGSSQGNLATGAPGDEVKRLYLAESPKTIELEWMSAGEQFASTSATYSPDAKLPMPEGTPANDPGWAFMGWWTEPEGGEQVTTDTPLPTDDATYYAHWTPLVAATAPLDATIRVDLLGVEDTQDADSYIESRSAGALKIAEISLEPGAGAAELFGADASQVGIKVIPEGATGPAAGVAFDLGQGSSVTDARSLLPFVLPYGYGSTMGIIYHLDVAPELIAAIDPAVFSDVTTRVAQVTYTVELVE